MGEASNCSAPSASLATAATLTTLLSITSGRGLAAKALSRSTSGLLRFVVMPNLASRDHDLGTCFQVCLELDPMGSLYALVLYLRFYHHSSSPKSPTCWPSSFACLCCSGTLSPPPPG